MELIVLTKSESSKLASLESTIQRNLASFYEIGVALMTIRDERLYRAEYDTFEEYCRNRWSFKKDYANKLIASSKVIENLNTIVSKPATESQARPLTKIKDPAEQKEIWKEAVRTAPEGKVTARHVQEVVEKKTTKTTTTTEETYSSGLIFVEFAISQMERIHPKDTQKKAAWARMRQWLVDHE